MGLFCTTLIALGFGLVLCAFGYRFFLYLLPFWGFFYGFTFGVQMLQALFGVGALATIGSWIGGLVAGALFAVLSYLFYIVGVALLASSLGYGLGVGLMNLIGLDMGFITWLVGSVVAIVLVWVTLNYNLQKFAVIAATSLGGSGRSLALAQARSHIRHPRHLVVSTSTAIVSPSWPGSTCCAIRFLPISDDPAATQSVFRQSLRSMVPVL